MAKLGAAMANARAKAASAAAATASTAEKVKCFCMRCFHRMAGHPAASKPDNNTIQLPTHNRMPPTQFGTPHGPHGHHHGFVHSVLAFARRMFTFVLLPVMVGVAVGITASAMGMLVGQAVVFLWMKYSKSFSERFQPFQEFAVQHLPDWGLEGDADSITTGRSDSRQAAYSAVESDDKEEGLPAYDPEGLPGRSLPGGFPLSEICFGAAETCFATQPYLSLAMLTLESPTAYVDVEDTKEVEEKA